MQNYIKSKKKFITSKIHLFQKTVLLKDLEINKINLICLAGFMRILSKNFIKKFNGKILNIHPSLLPKYKGLKTHERVLKNKEKFSGCTVHYVNSQLDAGKIIMQKKVQVSKKESPTIFKRKSFERKSTNYTQRLFLKY